MQAKASLIDSIDLFIRERITYADDLIIDNAKSKINDGDVILTYS